MRRSRGLTLAVILASALSATASVEAVARTHPRRRPRPQLVHGGSRQWPRLAWSDDFSGPSGSSPDPSKWGFDIGGNGWGNGELEYYTSRPENAELDGHGHLLVSARAETYTGEDGVTRAYTSARMQTLHKFLFRYGLVEARIKVPAGQGLLPAFWTLGQGAYERLGWPAAGEIDTMEVLGSSPNILHGTIHGPWPSVHDELTSNTRSHRSLAAGYHIYAIEWRPNRIRFLLDGRVYETVVPSDLPRGSAWPFRHPFFLVLDLAVGGEWPGPPNALTRFPAQMSVDWIRIWQ